MEYLKKQIELQSAHQWPEKNAALLQHQVLYLACEKLAYNNPVIIPY